MMMLGAGMGKRGRAGVGFFTSRLVAYFGFTIITCRVTTRESYSGMLCTSHSLLVT